jgi:hypothetical protein
VTWCAQSRINDHRHGGLFNDNLDLQTRFDPAIAADRRAERHHSCRTDVLQPFCQHRIGVDVRKNRESFFHQKFRRRQRLNRIWKQIARVGVNLELDPFRQACARRQPRQPHSLICIACAAGVRQKKKTFRVDKIENVGERIVFSGEISSPQGDCHKFRAAGNQRVTHQLVRREFSRPNKESRRELAIGNFQFRGLVSHWKKVNELARACEC